MTKRDPSTNAARHVGPVKEREMPACVFIIKL